MTSEPTIPAYAVGSNLAGYLPEGDVYLTRDWESARSALRDKLDRLADYLADGVEYLDSGWGDDTTVEEAIASVESALAEVDALTEGEVWSDSFGYEVYWLDEAEATEEDLDDE